MVSLILLLIGLTSIFLYVTPCASIYFGKVMVKRGEITFQIVLQNSITGLDFCGGNLINNLYVLTAAECVVHREANEITAYAALIRLDRRNVHINTRSIREIIIHELYDDAHPWQNDIALLRLRLFFHSAWISKSFVPQKYELNKILGQGKPLLVRLSGYGIIHEKKPPGSLQLMKSYTYIDDWEYCRKLYEKIQYNISVSHICAYDPYYIKKHRTSDVGSPLIIDKNLALGIALSASGGLRSETISNIVHYYPLLFTNVSWFSDWIHSQIADRFDEDDYGMKG